MRKTEIKAQKGYENENAKKYGNRYENENEKFLWENGFENENTENTFLEMDTKTYTLSKPGSYVYDGHVNRKSRGNQIAQYQYVSGTFYQPNLSSFV